MIRRDAPEISVVVLNWRSPDLAQNALGSAAEAFDKHRVELVVVENGSRRHVSTEGLPPTRRVVSPTNVGVARGRNLGIRSASGDYVLLLDDDAQALTSLSGLADFLEAHPTVGIVAPRVENSYGDLMFTCRRFPTLVDKVARRLPGRASVLAASEWRQWDHSYPALVDYVIGACQLIRRSVFDQVGLLDERYFYGPEDIDLCLRAWSAGWQVVYCPDAVVVHDERRVTTRPSVLALRHAAALARYFASSRYALTRRRLYARLGLDPRADGLPHPVAKWAE